MKPGIFTRSKQYLNKNYVNKTTISPFARNKKKWIPTYLLWSLMEKQTKESVRKIDISYLFYNSKEKKSIYKKILSHSLIYLPVIIFWIREKKPKQDKQKRKPKLHHSFRTSNFSFVFTSVRERPNSSDPLSPSLPRKDGYVAPLNYLPYPVHHQHC